MKSNTLDHEVKVAAHFFVPPRSSISKFDEEFAHLPTTLVATRLPGARRGLVVQMLKSDRLATILASVAGILNTINANMPALRSLSRAIMSNMIF